MKFFALFILMSFSFQTVDVPPLTAHKNPKTCCARKVCLCTHAKGAPCDYKPKAAPVSFSSPSERGRLGGGDVSAQDGDCPFHKGMKKSQMRELVSNAELAERVHTLARTKAGISQAPCHTNTPKSLIPQTVRDYEPPVSFAIEPMLPYQIWFQNHSKIYLSPGLSGPDHPPRLLLSI